MVTTPSEPGLAERLLAIDAYVLWTSRRSRLELGLTAAEWLIFLIVATSAIQRIMRGTPVAPLLLDSRPIPPDLLGAISRRRIADVSGMPFETVRRTVSGLVERGLLREAADGVRGRTGILAQFADAGLIYQARDRFLALWPVSEVEFAPRHESRLVAYHLANAGLDLQLSLGRQYGLSPAILELLLFLIGSPDPISQRDAARTLAVPRQTCRRWLALLASTGLVNQSADGVACAADALARHVGHPEAAERLRVAQSLRRMICLPADMSRGTAGE